MLCSDSNSARTSHTQVIPLIPRDCCRETELSQDLTDDFVRCVQARIMSDSATVRLPPSTSTTYCLLAAFDSCPAFVKRLTIVFGRLLRTVRDTSTGTFDIGDESANLNLLAAPGLTFDWVLHNRILLSASPAR